MTKEQALQHIHNNPGTYLQKARNEGYICPICGSGSGPEGTGIVPGTKVPYRFTCFAGHCFTGADIPDIIALKEGLKPGSGEALRRAYEVYGLAIDPSPTGHSSSTTRKEGAIVKPPAAQEQKGMQSVTTEGKRKEEQGQDYTEYFNQCQARISETTYPHERGLTADVIARFNLGYDPAFKTVERIDGEDIDVTWQALIMPNGPYHFTARNLNPEASKKNRYRFRGGSMAYNHQALALDQCVFIVEGEIDALSIAEAGGEAVAIGTNHNLLLDRLKPGSREKALLLALDKDEAGRNTEEKLQEGLKALGIPYLLADIAGEYKDANEALVKDRAGFTQAVQVAMNAAKTAKDAAQEAELAAYMKINAAASMDAFFADIAQKKEPYHTGFKALDTEIGGGLFEGLTIVGAETSLGKTTFTMQMADNMAKAGHDVLIFSLEMGSHELKARSLSRETLAACFNARMPIAQAMTATNILQGEPGPEGLLDAAKRTYAGYNRNVYIHENMGKIGTQRIQEEVERHKRLIGKTPVIFIDYLQLLGPNETRYAIGTKEVMDAAVNDLRNMGIKHRTPVILISSFNRMNYGKDANFTSFKESGGIEYSADVLLTLQYEGTRKGNWTQEAFENAAKATPRKMELKVMKNRGGPWGMRIAFDYYAAANMFTER